ncbi:nuclear transport factor 2 family protein [Nocardia araoensis]|uniref:nuclear transport factor 2 family protein n=1 Tax=Nocardia araoensis TaxID=228600 RepID=UPI000585B4D0|nr:nuclear transport factor 2 family protein [Nocardia araoensis]
MKARTALVAVLVCTGTVAACAEVPATSTDPGAPPVYSFDAEALEPTAQRYLKAVAAGDADAVAAAFAPDGLVIDVSRRIRGREAIRHWAAVEFVGGVYTVLWHSPRVGGTTLLVRFRLPGGEIRAIYSFDIADGLITRADLHYP